MLRPTSYRNLIVLSLNIDESSILNTLLQGTKNINRMAPIICHLIKHRLPLRQMTILRQRSVIRSKTDSWLELLNPAAWCEEVVGLFVDAFSLLCCAAPEHEADVDEVKGLLPLP